MYIVQTKKVWNIQHPFIKSYIKQKIWKKDIDKYLDTIKYDNILTQEEKKNMYDKDITKEELKYIIIKKNFKKVSWSWWYSYRVLPKLFFGKLKDFLLPVFKNVFEKGGLTNTKISYSQCSKTYLRKEAYQIHKEFRLWVFYTKRRILQI